MQVFCFGLELGADHDGVVLGDRSSELTESQVATETWFVGHSHPLCERSHLLAGELDPDS